MKRTFRIVVWLAVAALAVGAVASASAVVPPTNDREVIPDPGGGDGPACDPPVTDGDSHVNGSCDPGESMDLGTEYYKTIDGVASKCRKIQEYVLFRALITKLPIWKYWQDIEWCWSGGKITYIQRVRSAYLYDPGNFFWDFKGHISSSCMVYSGGYSPCSEKKGSSSAYISTQGKFQACITWLCWTKTPGLWMTINGYGKVVGWGTYS